ncbi:unnamed protein product [Amoebophrya sp. A25]|nr:unnamed protein product [Amoebophrya sp. A25]|eukprot:GSA25T00000373001.1
MPQGQKQPQSKGIAANAVAAVAAPSSSVAKAVPAASAAPVVQEKKPEQPSEAHSLANVAPTPHTSSDEQLTGPATAGATTGKNTQAAASTSSTSSTTQQAADDAAAALAQAEAAKKVVPKKAPTAKSPKEMLKLQNTVFKPALFNDRATAQNTEDEVKEFKTEVVEAKASATGTTPPRSAQTAAEGTTAVANTAHADSASAGQAAGASSSGKQGGDGISAAASGINGGVQDPGSAAGSTGVAPAAKAAGADGAHSTANMPASVTTGSAAAGATRTASHDAAPGGARNAEDLLLVKGEASSKDTHLIGGHVDRATSSTHPSNIVIATATKEEVHSLDELRPPKPQKGVFQRFREWLFVDMELTLLVIAYLVRGFFKTSYIAFHSMIFDTTALGNERVLVFALLDILTQVCVLVSGLISSFMLESDFTEFPTLYTAMLVLYAVLLVAVANFLPETLTMSIHDFVAHLDNPGEMEKETLLPRLNWSYSNNDGTEKPSTVAIAGSLSEKDSGDSGIYSRNSFQEGNPMGGVDPRKTVLHHQAQETSRIKRFCAIVAAAFAMCSHLVVAWVYALFEYLSTMFHTYLQLLLNTNGFIQLWTVQCFFYTLATCMSEITSSYSIAVWGWHQGDLEFMSACMMCVNLVALIASPLMLYGNMKKVETRSADGRRKVKVVVSATGSAAAKLDPVSARKYSEVQKSLSRQRSGSKDSIAAKSSRIIDSVDGVREIDDEERHGGTTRGKQLAAPVDLDSPISSMVNARRDGDDAFVGGQAASPMLFYPDEDRSSTERPSERVLLDEAKHGPVANNSIAGDNKKGREALAGEDGANILDQRSNSRTCDLQALWSKSSTTTTPKPTAKNLEDEANNSIGGPTRQCLTRRRFRSSSINPRDPFARRRSFLGGRERSSSSYMRDYSDDSGEEDSHSGYDDTYNEEDSLEETKMKFSEEETSIHEKFATLLIVGSLVNLFCEFVYTLEAPYSGRFFVFMNVIRHCLAFLASIRSSFIAARLPADKRAMCLSFFSLTAEISQALGCYLYANVLFDPAARGFSAGAPFRFAFLMYVLADVVYIYVFHTYRNPNKAVDEEQQRNSEASVDVVATAKGLARSAKNRLSLRGSLPSVAGNSQIDDLEDVYDDEEGEA